jgi:Ca-activated chloride channel family protein
MLIPVDRKLPPVSLKHTDINASIIGSLCDVLVTQQFHNTHTHPVEAVYVFPLPEDAAITELKLTIGERVVHGDIREREQAQREYAQASQAGQGAALLEQERPNIFTVSVANIQPDAEVQVTLRFHNRVPYDDGMFEFVLPTVVLPRYVPGGDEADAPALPDAERLHSPLLPDGSRDGHTLSVCVELDAGKLHDISSPSHQIDMTRQRGSTLVTLHEADAIPNKDFILRYCVAGSHIEAVPFTYRPPDKPGTLMLLLTPQVTLHPEDVLPRELLFVFDRSGSMAGQSIEQARNALQGCLRALNPEDTFTIITFDHEVDIFSEQPLPFTQNNLDRADAYISKLYGRGGTEIKQALAAALHQPRDSERLRVVVFLTDGAVGNEDQILRTLGHELNEARVYAFGVGSAVNRFFLDKLAQVGRGSVEYIFPGESIEDAVQRFQKRAAFPVLVDVQIDWDHGRVTDVFPERLPDLYAGQPLSILARFHNATTARMRLSGRTPRGHYEQVLEVELPEATPDRSEHWAALAQVWARARIDALMQRERMEPRQKNTVRDEILGLALEHHLLSPYTAFVAIEEHRDEHAQRDGAESVAVPIHLPYGTRREAFESQSHQHAHVYGMAPAAPSPAVGPVLMRASQSASPDMSEQGTGLLRLQSGQLQGNLRSRGGARMFQRYAPPKPAPAETATTRATRALRYLGRTQHVDGDWDGTEIATALALLAFVQHGHTDRTGDFRPQLSRTAGWLCQRAHEPQVSPVVAWALRILAAATGDESHRAAAEMALSRAVAADELDQEVLACARQTDMHATPAAPSKRQPLKRLLHNEHDSLALVLQLWAAGGEAQKTADLLVEMQHTGGSSDGAIVPPGHKADRPGAAVAAATAAAALAWGRVEQQKQV